MEICRICMLIIDSVDSVNIYSEIKDESIAIILEKISGIEVEKDDLLPEIICKSCFTKVETFCELRDDIINSHDSLKDVIEKKSFFKEEYLEEVNVKEEFENVSIEYLDIEDFKVHTYLEPPNEKLIENIPGIITKATNNLRCCECHEIFHSVNDLIAHGQRVHTEKQTETFPTTDFPCPVCLCGFKSQKHVSRHLQQAQNVSYECYTCSVILKTNVMAKEHVEDLHKEPIFKCCGCTFVTESKQSLIEHGQSVHFRKKSDNPAIPIQCEICYIGLTSAMGYKMHKTTSYKPKNPESRPSIKGRINVENFLVCCGCKTTFSIDDESALISHRDQEHGPRRVRDEDDLRPECDFCFKRFANKAKLVEHFKEIQKKQLRKKTLICGLCQLPFKCENTLLAHIKEHTDGTFKAFKCCGCKEQYNTREELLEHSQEVHAKKKKVYLDNKERPFECEICFRAYGNKKVLHGHQRSQYYKEKKNYICDVCGKVFPTSNMLRYHSMTHKGVKDFKCVECGREFYNKVLLNMHIKRIHTVLEDKFECKECGKKFKHTENFRSHLASHSTERPFTCDLCNKTFRRANHLKIHHVRNHTMERNYQCRYCESKFLFSFDRKKHEMRHTGQYPHKCKICNKNFVKKFEMVSHYESHIPDSKKIYKCTHCDKKFSVKEHLEGHFKGTHNEHSLQEIRRRQQREEAFEDMIKEDYSSNEEDE